MRDQAGMSRYRVAVVWRPLGSRTERFRTWTECLATSGGSAETWAAGSFAARGRLIESVTALAVDAPTPA